MKTKTRQLPLTEAYNALYEHFGPQHWWPGRTRLEVIIGAILTQHTAWTNVEKALKRLRQEGALNLACLHRTRQAQLATWIKSSGTYNAKARRIKLFVKMVHDEFGGSLNKLFSVPTDQLRKALLSVWGIGPETADCIMLYAGKHPVFVVDAYTNRMAQRHGWIGSRATYRQLADTFSRQLPANEKLFNEYHALIVQLGKTYCRATPSCETCPLKDWLPASGPRRYIA